MCEEVFEMVCAMDRRNIELQIALQCAPCLAGLKTSNLLIVPKEDEEKVRFVLRHTRLQNFRLAYDRKRVIFLVFNRGMLSEYLATNEVKSFLNGLGYKTDSFGYILRTFKDRYSAYITLKSEFPHEMGLLLGYPYKDVVGFIEHHGRDFKLSGYWKVYDDAEYMSKLFDEFDYAKDDMVRLISTGTSIKEIIDLYQNDELSERKAV